MPKKDYPKLNIYQFMKENHGIINDELCNTGEKEEYRRGIDPKVY